MEKYTKKLYRLRELRNKPRLTDEEIDAYLRILLPELQESTEANCGVLEQRNPTNRKLKKR